MKATWSHKPASLAQHAAIDHATERSIVRVVATTGLENALACGYTLESIRTAILRVRIATSLRMAKRERWKGAVLKAAARRTKKRGLDFITKVYEAGSRKAYRQASRYMRQAVQASLRQA